MKVRFRHKLVINTLGQILIKVFAKKFNLVSAEKAPIDGPFVALANHCSDYDVFFLARSLKAPYYFVMSDHIASLPKLGKLLHFALAPIPITKSGRMEIGTLRSVMTAIEQKASVCIFPEGNKSCAGDMSHIQKTIVKLVKNLGVPVIVYNIIGAYISNPRWALNKKRRGEVSVKITRILTPEEMKEMDNDALYDIIVDSLRVNAYDIQDQNPIKFVGERLAEGFEHMFYRCPKCNAISSLTSNENTIHCTKCDASWIYTEEGYLEGGYFKRLDEWDNWQKEETRAIDADALGEDDVLLEDAPWTISKKLLQCKNELLGEFTSKLYKNRLELISETGESLVIPLDRIRAMALEGKNGIQITTMKGVTYRFNNTTLVSGIKYLHYIWALLKTDMLY